jgi:hypothetical protein
MNCKVCNKDLPQESFFFRLDTGKYRSDCKDCCREAAKIRRRLSGTPSREDWLKSVTKYNTKEERKEAARKRAKQWYMDNKGKLP